MEIAPDLFSWLSETCQFKNWKSEKVMSNGNVIIPDKVYERLQDGHHFKYIIKKIEEQYNNCYKMKLNYTTNLINVKKATDTITREENWKIISETLSNFGIELTERLISDIINDSQEALGNILKTLYTLSSELLRSKLELQNSNPESTKSQDINNDHIDILSDKKPVKETIDVNEIYADKHIEDSESCLEFFMLSLRIALEMKPKQAAALLSNNHKYLVQIVNKGVKSSFTKIINWFELIMTKKQHLLYLLRYSNEDSKRISFSLLSVGLFSRNYHVALHAYSILNHLINELNLSSGEWFLKEGIEAFIFCINKHPIMRVNLLNLFELYSNNQVNIAFDEITRRLQDKEIVSFIESILTVVKELNPSLQDQIKKFMYKFCNKGELNTTNQDKSNQKIKSFLSVLSEFWIVFNESLDELESQEILGKLKLSVRDSECRINQKVAIIELFRTFMIFARKKEKTAPILYKNLVFLFLEYYNDVSIRELFILQFNLIFSKEKSIPVKILLEPYLRQLQNSSNYTFCELQFLLKITNHPKFDTTYLKDVYEFLCYVNLSNLFYNKMTRMKICELTHMYKLNNDLILFLVEFIRNSIRLYRETKETIFLETVYDLIRLKISDLNKLCENEILATSYSFREENGKLPLSLISILWYFDSHDDFLLKIEEIYTPKDEPRPIKPKKHIPKGQDGNIKEIVNKKVIIRPISKRLDECRSAKDGNRVKKSLKKQVEVNPADVTTVLPSKNDISILKNQSTLIKESNQHSKIDISGIRNHSISTKELLNIPKKVMLPFVIPLDEEENREKLGIETICSFYKKNLQFYFRKYLTEKNGVIKRSQFLKFFRDMNIDNEILTLDDLNGYIRVLFGVPLNTLDYNQFIIATYHLSYFIYNKRETNYTLSQAFEEFCKKLILPKVYTKEEKDIKNIIEEKCLKSNNPLPPGFKRNVKKKIEYEYIIKGKTRRIYGEKRVICLEILDEILTKALNIHLIEPRVKATEIAEIVVNEQRPKWSLNTLLAYTDMDPNEFDKGNIIDVGYLVEDMLSALEKGNSNLDNTIKKIHPKELGEMNEKMANLKQAEEQDRKRKLRQQVIKKEVEMIKRKKEEEKRKQEEEKTNQKVKEEEKIKLAQQKELDLRRKVKDELQHIKTQKEIITLQAAENEKKKLEEIKKEKEKERGDFLLKQKKKLKDQFKSILEEKKKVSQVVDEPLPEINIKKVFEKEKSFIEFEKSLYNTAQNLVNRVDIKEVFKEYETHFNALFDIYSKFGQNKLGVLIENMVQYNQFREFCLDFNILGLLINTEQMQYIFHKVCRSNEGEKDEKKYFNFNDFLVAFMLLCLYSKYTNKSRKLLPDDVKKIDQQTFRSFVEFIGLKHPFNKKQLEDYINDRRALSTKQILSLKKELLSEVKNFNEKLKEQDPSSNKIPIPKRIMSSKLKSPSPPKAKSVGKNNLILNNIKELNHKSNKKLIEVKKTRSKEPPILINHESNEKKIKNDIIPKRNISEEVKNLKENNNIDTKASNKNEHKFENIIQGETHPNIEVVNEFLQEDLLTLCKKDEIINEIKGLGIDYKHPETTIEESNVNVLRNSKRRRSLRQNKIVLDQSREHIDVHPEVSKLNSSYKESEVKNEHSFSARVKSGVKREKIDIDDQREIIEGHNEKRNMNVIGPNGEIENWEIHD